MIDEEQAAFKNQQIAITEHQHSNALSLWMKIGICLLFVLFLVSTMVNVFGMDAVLNKLQQYGDYSFVSDQEKPKQIPEIDGGDSYEIAEMIQDQQVRLHDNTEQIQQQNLKSIKGFELYPIPANTTKRISMSAPTPRPRRMRIVSITKQTQKVGQDAGDCLLTNGVNVISNTTIASGNAVLKQPNFIKWILILDAYDPFADALQLAYLKQEGTGLAHEEENVTVDSQYRFIRKYTHQCKYIVYAQNYFTIDSKQLSSAMLSHSNQSLNVLYSKNAVVNSTLQQLVDLNATDLSTIQEQYLNKYLFVFDARYLNVITPLNYAYYARYTVEQLILQPLLAISQGSPHLIALAPLLHQLEEPVLQFKQFELKQIEKQRPQKSPLSYILRNTAQDMCFVSYPDQPHSPSLDHLTAYLQSLTDIANVKNSTVIVNLPYLFNQKISLWVFYAKLHQLAQRDFNIRLRIRVNKTVSSLSAYEAVYTYCPNSSTLITSRHNILFNSNFLNQLLPNIVATHHYYFCSFIAANNTLVQQQSIFEYRKKQFRIQAMYYRDYFMHMQIFKMDLFKMMYFWILKSDEVDFYESQSSFTLPLLQMIRLRIIIIKKKLYRVAYQRQETTIESEQLQNLKLYYEWTPIPSHKINPFLNNSLLNIAFRRNAPEKIPRIIHQTWIGTKPINSFQMKLHQSLIQVNKDFDFKLWKDQNITMENFPITFALIKRSLQYQQFSNRSYIAPIASLIRYETLYHNGGIYIDFKTEGRKPLNPFLKYEQFFIDIDYEPNHYGNPSNVGNGIMGAIKYNYHLLLVLTELVSQEKFNYHAFDFPKIVGGYVLRKSLTMTQLFTTVGFGFQLFSPKPGTGKANLCSYQENNFTADQQIFEIDDYLTGKKFKIGLPCRIYKQSYLIMYKVLAGTWKFKISDSQTSFLQAEKENQQINN